MRPIHPFYYFVLLVFLSSCNLLSSDHDTETNLKVEPLQDSYALENDTEVKLLVKNVSSKTIYSSVCEHGYVEELDDSKITNALIYDPQCVCDCTFSIKPGKERELTVRGTYILIHDGFLFTTDRKYVINPDFFWDKNLTEHISSDTYKKSPITLTKKPSD